MKPLAIDLFCGLGGWTEGLLAEGYDVIGFDIERHDYGTGGYPAQLVLQDVLTLHGSQFRNASLIVASPPCQEYSYRAMPWKRAKALPPPDNSLFEACFRIQQEACEVAGRHIPLVVENVQGAQRWVGRAAWHFGSFYLWGDVPAIMPFSRKSFKTVANIRDGHTHTRHLTNQRESDMLKNGGGVSWFPISHGRRTHAGTYGKNPVRGSGIDGIKVPGNRLSENGFTIPVARTIDKRLKPEEFELSANDRRLHLSFSRKAASAQIAKIPFELASWIARVYKPEEQAA